jgi:hypothetical protein
MYNFLLYVSHNEECYGGWKSSTSPKSIIFTIHLIDAKLVITINHSILTPKGPRKPKQLFVVFVVLGRLLLMYQSFGVLETNNVDKGH